MLNKLIPDFISTKYTHLAHVIVDGALGALIIIQPFLAAHDQDWIGLGMPEHWVTVILGGVLVVSQIVRRAAALLEAIAPEDPVVAPVVPVIPVTLKKGGKSDGI